VGLRVLGAEAVREALPMARTIDALEVAFRDLDLSTTPQRARLATETGQLLLMPAWTSGAVGVKLITLTPANEGTEQPVVNGLYVLFDGATGAPAAVLDGAELTARRTAAVSGLAARYLAPPEAHVLVVFGAGVQGRAHVEAMRAVRPVDRVRIVSRTPERAEELAADLLADGLEAATGPPEVVAEADLVCTCTTSSTPVVDGRLVRGGAHVTAVGAYTPTMREIDSELVARSRLVVETREAALEEAGDLLMAIGDGVVDAGHIVADLQEVVRGAPARRGADDVTLFKSVGSAFEDLVVAEAALRGP
jgi:ornithine cyclodeaminase/alanine dehydrogenase-like protein (mu-crystallin family)